MSRQRYRAQHAAPSEWMIMLDRTMLGLRGVLLAAAVLGGQVHATLHTTYDAPPPPPVASARR